MKGFYFFLGTRTERPSSVSASDRKKYKKRNIKKGYDNGRRGHIRDDYLERETTGRCGTRSKFKGGGTRIHFDVIRGEIGLEQRLSLAENRLAGVLAQFLNVIEAAGLFNNLCVGVDTLVVILKGLTLTENILQTFKRDSHHTDIRSGNQLTQRLNAALGDELGNLRGSTTGSGVSNSPGSFLTDIEFGVLHVEDQRVHNGGIQDGLDLCTVSSGNVGQSPAHLSLDALLVVSVKHELEGRETARGDGHLGLDFITSDDVTNHTESRGLNSTGLMVEETNSGLADTSLEDAVDLALIITIRNVRESPASISNDIGIRTVEEVGQNRDSRKNEFEGRSGLATAQVGDGPDNIATEGRRNVLTSLLEQQFHSTQLKKMIPAQVRVTGNVTKGPDGLFLDQVAGVGIGNLVDEGLSTFLKREASS